MKSFSIEINIQESFTVDEIWPDGDAPENPTVDDVKKVFFKNHDVPRTCEDWGMGIRREDVTITDNSFTEDQLARLVDAKARIEASQQAVVEDAAGSAGEAPEDARKAPGSP